MKSFDIVIVNWNSGSQLKECVDSITQAAKNNFKLQKIIVVDNASIDSSLDLLDKNKENLMIIQNQENFGFGKACNIGAKYSNSDFILFLNPDTLIFKDSFVKLFNYIDKNDNNGIGVYGIQLLDVNGHIQKSCARLPNLWNMFVRSTGLNKFNKRIFKTYAMDDWDHKQTKETNHVMGAFYLIKRNIFIDLSGFDERYFVYIEDLDLSKRVYDNGYKSIYVTGAQAYHKGGGTSENVKAKRLFYSTRSRIIYGFKHFGLLQASFLLIFTFLVEPFTRTFFLLLKRKYSEIFETFKGFGMLYKDTFNIIKLGLQK